MPATAPLAVPTTPPVLMPGESGGLDEFGFNASVGESSGVDAADFGPSQGGVNSVLVPDAGLVPNASSVPDAGRAEFAVTDTPLSPSSFDASPGSELAVDPSTASAAGVGVAVPPVQSRSPEVVGTQSGEALQGEVLQAAPEDRVIPERPADVSSSSGSLVRQEEPEEETRQEEPDGEFLQEEDLSEDSFRVDANPPLPVIVEQPEDLAVDQLDDDTSDIERRTSESRVDSQKPTWTLDVAVDESRPVEPVLPKPSGSERGLAGVIPEPDRPRRDVAIQAQPRAPLVEGTRARFHMQSRNCASVRDC